MGVRLRDKKGAQPYSNLAAFLNSQQAMLPSKEVLLAAASRRDWRGVLGLGRYEQLTEKAARNFRVQVHPDKGGDPEVAKVVGQAVEALLEDARGQQRWWEEEQQRERRREQEERQQREQRARDQWAFDAAWSEWNLRWAAWKRRLQQERPSDVNSQAYCEWLERLARFNRRESADLDRFTATWQTGYRGPATWEEPEPRPQPAPQPAETATAQRKRRLAEAARERRKRQRPANAAEIIRGRCEPCTVEEASSVDAVREALKAAGCNKTDLNAIGLNSSNRRQRGTNSNKTYFVFKFEGELQPLRVR